MSTTATNLRWRARASNKEAVNSWDGDDQSTVGSATGSSVNHNKRGYSTATLFLRGCCLNKTCLLDSVSAIAASCAVLSLQMTHVWFMAVASTLTVAFSLLTVWQHRRLRKLKSLRHVQNQTRATANSLRQQNERLYRNLAVLDHSVDKFHKVQSDLSRLAGSNNQDLDRLVTMVQQWKQVNEQMRDKLQLRVANKIVQAVVSSDADSDFELSPQEMERLILQLAALPGVQTDEALLRQQLAGDTSLDAILNLLRQVTVEPVNTRKIGLPTQRCVFSYEPAQLLPTSTSTSTTRSGSSRGLVGDRHEC